MKTKILLLSTGAFLCFNTLSYAQYSNGNSSSNNNSNSNSGSGDGSFQRGNNIITFGIGFGSGLGKALGSGYTGSVGPGLELSWEHALSSNWGISLVITDQSASESTSSTVPYYDYVYDPSTGYNDIYTTVYSETTTDAYTYDMLTFCARGAYHFTSGPKFDPYIGVMLGYCTISFTDDQSYGFSNIYPISIQVTRFTSLAVLVQPLLQLVLNLVVSWVQDTISATTLEHGLNCNMLMLPLTV
jgi:hypothetical protein